MHNLVHIIVDKSHISYLILKHVCSFIAFISHILKDKEIPQVLLLFQGPNHHSTEVRTTCYYLGLGGEGERVLMDPGIRERRGGDVFVEDY